MEAVQFVLPTIGTIALGAALLVPLRDGRRGRRATLGGAPTPLRARFVTKAESSYPAEGAGSDVIDVIDATDACDRTNGVGDGASRETHVRADVGADVGPPPIRAESETFESVPPTRGTTAHPRALDDDACSAHATTSCEDGLEGLSRLMTPYRTCSSRGRHSGVWPAGMGAGLRWRVASLWARERGRLGVGLELEFELESDV